MPFKLTREERTEYTTLYDRAFDHLCELNDLIEKGANTPEAREAITTALTSYNDSMVECKSFAQRLIEDWRNEWDERSDSWQDSDTGQDADSFIVEWEDFDPTPAEVDFDNLEPIEQHDVDMFQELPEEVH